MTAGGDICFVPRRAELDPPIMPRTYDTGRDPSRPMRTRVYPKKAPFTLNYGNLKKNTRSAAQRS